MIGTPSLISESDHAPPKVTTLVGFTGIALEPYWWSTVTVCDSDAASSPGEQPARVRARMVRTRVTVRRENIRLG